jgi:hypothetical protein
MVANDNEHEDHGMIPDGCRAGLAISLVLWLIIMAVVRACWPV